MAILKRLDRLIGRTVLISTVVALVLLVALDAFIAFAGELTSLGKGNYTVFLAFEHIIWTLPRRVYEAFAMAAIIGSLVAMGGLAASGEMTAMRAAGMAKFRIALSVLVSYALMAALAFVWGETVAPWAEQQAKMVRAQAKSQNSITTGRTGLWARDGEVLINAKRGELVGTKVKLFDLRLYEFTSSGQLARLVLAAFAQHEQGQWVLHDVVRQTFLEQSVENEKMAVLPWDGYLDPAVLAQVVTEPRFLALRELKRSMAYLKRNRLDFASLEAAYWQRLFFPVNALLLVFAVLPFAFGTLRSGGLGKRIMVGITLAMSWYFFQRGLANVALVYQIDFRIAQGLPALALTLGAGYYFKRFG